EQGEQSQTKLAPNHVLNLLKGTGSRSIFALVGASNQFVNVNGGLWHVAIEGPSHPLIALSGPGQRFLRQVLLELFQTLISSGNRDTDANLPASLGVDNNPLTAPAVGQFLDLVPGDEPTRPPGRAAIQSFRRHGQREAHRLPQERGAQGPEQRIEASDR